MSAPLEVPMKGFSPSVIPPNEPSCSLTPQACHVPSLWTLPVSILTRLHFNLPLTVTNFLFSLFLGILSPRDEPWGSLQNYQKFPEFNLTILTVALPILWLGENFICNVFTISTHLVPWLLKSEFSSEHMILYPRLKAMPSRRTRLRTVRRGRWLQQGHGLGCPTHHVFWTTWPW